MRGEVQIQPQRGEVRREQGTRFFHFSISKYLDLFPVSGFGFRVSGSSPGRASLLCGLLGLTGWLRPWCAVALRSGRRWLAVVATLLCLLSSACRPEQPADLVIVNGGEPQS